MQSLRIRLLGSNVGMAVYAEAGHAGSAPEGRMTGRATRANFCMGGDTAERFTRLGIKYPRTEKNAAMEYQHDCQNDSRKNCNYEAGTGETTGTRIMHT